MTRSVRIINIIDNYHNFLLFDHQLTVKKIKKMNIINYKTHYKCIPFFTSILNIYSIVELHKKVTVHSCLRETIKGE